MVKNSAGGRPPPAPAAGPPVKGRAGGAGWGGVKAGKKKGQKGSKGGRKVVECGRGGVKKRVIERRSKAGQKRDGQKVVKKERQPSSRDFGRAPARKWSKNGQNGQNSAGKLSGVTERRSKAGQRAPGEKWSKERWSKSGQKSPERKVVKRALVRKWSKERWSKSGQKSGRNSPRLRHGRLRRVEAAAVRRLRGEDEDLSVQYLTII